MQSMTFSKYFKHEKLTSLKGNSVQATEEWHLFLTIMQPQYKF